MNRSVGKASLTKGYLKGAATPTGSDLWKNFLPKQHYSLKIHQKYLDQSKSNSNTTERHIMRSSPQSDLET